VQEGAVAGRLDRWQIVAKARRELLADPVH
jgi:hypothetical protein